MDINKNKKFKFVAVGKDNNYYDLPYEIKDLDDDINFSVDDYTIDKTYIDYIEI